MSTIRFDTCTQISARGFVRERACFFGIRRLTAEHASRALAVCEASMFGSPSRAGRRQRSVVVRGLLYKKAKICQLGPFHCAVDIALVFVCSETQRIV